jgi:Fic family protein
VKWFLLNAFTAMLQCMRPFVPQTLPLAELDWGALIPRIGLANRALAEYNGVLYSLPNPGILLAPFTTKEAVLSSKIEGTQATLGEVFKFEAGEAPEQESRREDIHEILNYRAALRHAEEALEQRPFGLNLLLALHAQLLDSVRGQNKGRGLFRTEQNWIGAAGSRMEEARFVPPAPGEVLRRALDNWEAYYHADEPDALVQLAVVHAQFEILHPFLDGNGRLGRILIPLFLHEKQILSRPVFYLSEYLEQHREQYVERLRAIGTEAGSWDAWVAFFLDGLIAQAQANTRKVREIHDLYAALKAQVLETTHSQFAVPLLDLMFAQPVFRSIDLDRLQTMPSKPMIANLLGRLKKIGMLQVVQEGRGPRAQVLALGVLVNLCEGKAVV